MPRSKRDKEVVLSKTKKKGRPMKEKLVEDIRKCVEEYPYCYVFSVENSRGNFIKTLRAKLKLNSRFFLGKVKVMGLALGRGKGDEYRDNLHKVTKKLKGQAGLIFTKLTRKQMLEFVESHTEIEYARSGCPATETVTLPEGAMDPELFPFSVEPYLRKLGLPTALKKGTVTLLQEYTVCKVGVSLTPEQAKLLKLLCRPMAECRIELLCMYDRAKASVITLNKGKGKQGGDVSILGNESMNLTTNTMDFSMEY